MYNIEASRKKEAAEAKAKQLERMDPMCECEPYIYLPNFRVEKKDVPEVAKWKVGDEYEMKIKVRMTSYEEHKSLRQEDSRAHAEFDIVGIEPEEEKKLS